MTTTTAIDVVSLTAGPVEYRSAGHGPPVVLLHGLFMTGTVWDEVMPALPDGFRYVRPTLPLGAHRLPMRTGTDLGMDGQVRLVAEFLDALDLDGVTLVHNDWGGGLFLTAMGLDRRVGRHVITPCEAFDNFPPGLPGRVAALSGRLPGGVAMGLRALRVPALRRLPLTLGRMTRRGVPQALAREWTAPGLADPAIRRDIRAYTTAPIVRAEFVRRTEALARFEGDALVLWSTCTPVMPAAHGRRLAGLLRRAQLREFNDASVLMMLDQPGAVAAEMAAFLSSPPPP